MPKLLTRMTARSPDEDHRVSTPLELLFDLVFVVAISQAGSGLHHALDAGHIGGGILSYVMVFFGIWWAWMNFTWFASAYDADDVPYRLAVFVQITGALVFAAGAKAMFESRDLNILTLGGYVLMRLAQVGQWLRVSRSDPERRLTSLRYAGGITLIQALWCALYWAPHAWIPFGFVLLGLAEVGVPVWAEKAAQTTWHPHHISERYGLFTIIVLGESILAATGAIQTALKSGANLWPIVVGGLLVIYAMWWLYFYREVHGMLHRARLSQAILWGYGHFFVFASAAAVGAGLAVVVDHLTGAEHFLSERGAGLCVAIPVAIYLASLWYLHAPVAPLGAGWLGAVVMALVLVAPFVAGSYAVLWVGLALVGMLVYKLVSQPAGDQLPESKHSEPAPDPS